MANMLGVCAKTVQRRLKDYGLSITDTHSNVSNDSQVNEILIQKEFLLGLLKFKQLNKEDMLFHPKLYII